MNKRDNKNIIEIIYIFLRYIALFIIVLIYPIFYKILMPATIYSSGFLLSIFYNVVIKGNIILINTLDIVKIIPSCIAAAAYVLLLILNLSVKMNYKKRIYSILFSFALLFVINVIRIFILTIVYLDSSASFDMLHKAFWYLLSTLFVVAVWLISIKIFKIKKIPFYSDFKRIKKMK